MGWIFILLFLVNAIAFFVYVSRSAASIQRQASSRRADTQSPPSSEESVDWTPPERSRITDPSSPINVVTDPFGIYKTHQ
jgi:hypothetical protein